MRVAVSLVAAASLTVLHSASVLGNTEDYRAPDFFHWKPGYGLVFLEHKGGDDPFPHKVRSYFEWETSRALWKLDSPRTPTHQGTYEHELRFLQTGSNPYWCSFQNGVGNAHTNLPQGSYFDFVDVNPGEFTWGVPGWRVQTRILYSTTFDCVHTIGSDTGASYRLSGQIGHCHRRDMCNSTNVFADESVHHIPKPMGKVPSFAQGYTAQNFWDTLGHNSSFEWGSLQDYWGVSNGQLERVCSNQAYEGYCYARMTRGNGDPMLRLDVRPLLASVARSRVYSDFALRCPTSNASNCRVRLFFRGRDSSGNTTAQPATGELTIPRGNQWYWVDAKTINPFPSNTRSWRFKLKLTSGTRILIDYGQQSYWIHPD